MAVKAPYRFQMYMDADLREAIRRIAYLRQTSMNTLVYNWIEEKVREEYTKEANEAPSKNLRYT